MMDAEQLLKDNMGLAGYLAIKFHNLSQPEGYFSIDDIFQEGAIGLWKACRTFSPEKGYKFSTYAGKCITNQILMFFRKEGRMANKILSLDSVIKELDEKEKISYLNMLVDERTSVEAEVLATDLKEFYLNEQTQKKFKKRQPQVEERERKIYELLVSGYKQKEMVNILGSSQRVCSMHMANIRERLNVAWLELH